MESPESASNRHWLDITIGEIRSDQASGNIPLALDKATRRCDALKEAVKDTQKVEEGQGEVDIAEWQKQQAALEEEIRELEQIIEELTSQTE